MNRAVTLIFPAAVYDLRGHGRAWRIGNLSPVDYERLYTTAADAGMIQMRA
jgi:pimeloyl-ACP methyl ester carboxylesterase